MTTKVTKTSRKMILSSSKKPNPEKKALRWTFRTGNAIFYLVLHEDIKNGRQIQVSLSKMSSDWMMQVRNRASYGAFGDYLVHEAYTSKIPLTKLKRAKEWAEQEALSILTILSRSRSALVSFIK